MTTYTILTGSISTEGSIKNWLVKSDVPADTVLDDAESWIYRRLRVRDMLTTTTGTLSASVAVLALPTNYLAVRKFTLTSPGVTDLERKTPEETEDSRSYDNGGTLITGRPSVFYADGSQFVFDRTTDQAYTYRIIHYAEPTALSSSNTSNFLSTRGVRLLRCACLAFANEWYKNGAEKDYWLKQAQLEIDALQREDDIESWDMNADVVVG